MTAVSLFDCIARDQGATPGSHNYQQLVEFAQKLVAASLADLQRLREYEKGLSPETEPIPPGVDLEILHAIHRLYSEWADEAEQVLKRACSVAGRGTEVAEVDQLADAIGRVRARLSVTPDQVASAVEQVRQGQVVPARELRNELHARLRA